ncbi:uncharacterized protein V2V93DRAFT_372929 [Kockiozyma suomiensis]|uniref:uncharacterized protein n=1 Tax=Kockiozyma suomiensis TaxID=1337062 RepID=UPI0033431062
MGRLYPRSLLRRIIKRNSKQCNISKRADVLIYLNYILFLEELLKRSNIEARQAGDKKLRQRHIERVAKNTLQKFRG